MTTDYSHHPSELRRKLIDEFVIALAADVVERSSLVGPTFPLAAARALTEFVERTQP